MIREQIRQTPEYQSIAATEATQAAANGQSVAPRRQVQSVEAAVAPVVSLEKSDVEFWMQVLQVVLLYLVWQELRRL